MVQLSVTAIGVAITAYVESVRDFLVINWWIGLIGCLVYLVILFPLICSRNLARKVPTNFILLGILTLGMTVAVMQVCATVEPEIVACAAIITAMMTMGLMLYAMVAKTDFTALGGLLFAISFVLLGVGIMSIFFFNQWLYNIYVGLSVILVSFYIIFDT